MAISETSWKELIPEPLQKQVNVYRHLLGEEYRNTVTQHALENTVWTIDQVLGTRNMRAIEVQSEETKNAAKIANNLYSAPPFQVLCIDGRVLPVLIGGFSAGIAGALRLPAGDIKEVVRDGNNVGEYKIEPNSNLSRLLDEVFEKNDRINQILDSHIGCAAKKGDRTSRGEQLNDDGLLNDVIRKKQIAHAMKKLVEAKYGNKKQIAPIQFSFDPHNGFGYMGLETNTALQKAKEANGFAPQVLDTLVLSNSIISTKALALDPTIQTVFAKYMFKIDWRDQYSYSALQFWTNVASMLDEALIPIKQRVEHIYGAPISNEEKDDRALLLLTNTYSGFLHNSLEQGYPYDKHVEEGIHVSVGAYGPYETPFFAVHNNDIDNLPGTVDFASGIVRQNRIDGRVVKPGMFDSKEEFVGSPVLTLISETLKQEDVSLNHIQNMDFSDLPYSGWYQMSDEEFGSYLLQKNKDVNLLEYEVVNDLRHKMMRLYLPRIITADKLLEGNLIALPVITDKNRGIKAIIPFFMRGY